MPAPRTVPRSPSGLFTSTCSKCGKTREAKTRPRGKTTMCWSCANTGQVRPHIVLSDESVAAYRNGLTAKRLADSLSHSVHAVLKALRRQGVTVRDNATVNRSEEKRRRCSETQKLQWKTNPNKRRMAKHQSELFTEVNRLKQQKRGGRPSIAQKDPHHLQILAEVRSRCTWDKVPAEMLRLTKQQKSVEGWRTVFKRHLANK